jgi:hypothetical protein
VKDYFLSTTETNKPNILITLTYTGNESTRLARIIRKRQKLRTKQINKYYINYTGDDAQSYST